MNSRTGTGVEDASSLNLQERKAKEHVGTHPYQSTSIFADEEEERDWKSVMAYYMEYPDPLPTHVKWNAYHWAQFYASISIPLGRKWSWMTGDPGQVPSSAPMQQAQGTDITFVSSEINDEALQPGFSSEPYGKRKVSLSAAELTSDNPRTAKKSGEIHSARESCYVVPHVRERNRRQRELRQMRQREELAPQHSEKSTKLLNSSSSQVTSFYKEPGHQSDPMLKRSFHLESNSESSRSAPTAKKKYVRKQVYEEMKREREMVIESLKAHAQQEEEMRRNKRLM
ncbi:hypothetical protein C0993_006198 [Termitomyces sp. T159_Od127]|nr:hypothetical protein C0993_006198 [Termitomyces sp. T159_Od127]